MAEIILPDSFDEFVKDEIKTNQAGVDDKQQSLDDLYRKERLKWSDDIKAMTIRLKNVMEIQLLMVDVYSERQRAVEYYHYLISLLIGVNKSYRRKYAERFKHYTDSIQIRVNKDQINNLINNDVESLALHREKLENHAKFMNNTVSTIDNIIYGIKYRIEIEQISRGK